jgi:outer membrane translocation and assembly module TamA
VNAQGNIIGGKYLAVASGEYEYYFNEDWGAACSSMRATRSSTASA